jgi:hypothetical protein
MATRKSGAKKPAAKKSSKKSSSKKSSAKKSSSKKGARKRTLIEPHPGDKRYVRRSAGGQFKTEVNVGKSLAADRRSKSKTKSKPGFGDKGDR